MKRRNRDLVLIVPPCDGKCSCRDFLLECAERLADEETNWTFEQLSALEDTIYTDLVCVASRCLDYEFRAYAIFQLRDAHWNEQKARDKFRLQ